MDAEWYKQALKLLTVRRDDSLTSIDILKGTIRVYDVHHLYSLNIYKYGYMVGIVFKICILAW